MLAPTLATTGTGGQAAASSLHPQPRLVKAAHEFEAQMMSELMKPLTSGDGLTGDDDGENSGGALNAFAGEALGRAISAQGGLGIANKIVGALSRTGNQPGKAGVT